MTGGRALAAGPVSSAAGVVPERAGQRRQLAHGDVALARLDLDQEPRGEPRAPGQLLQGEAALARAAPARGGPGSASSRIGVHLLVHYTASRQRESTHYSA